VHCDELSREPGQAIGQQLHVLREKVAMRAGSMVLLKELNGSLEGTTLTIGFSPSARTGSTGGG
jgi:hypothetical protein